MIMEELIPKELIRPIIKTYPKGAYARIDSMLLSLLNY